jgi:aryl-alcohol dehydrogenase-like predicted oxidoreductase
VQPPYHLFRRGIEAGLPPYAAAHHIGVLACGPLARGLPGGTLTAATTFGPADWRSHSPAFTGPGSGPTSTRPIARSAGHRHKPAHKGTPQRPRRLAQRHYILVKLTLVKRKCIIVL